MMEYAGLNFEESRKNERQLTKVLEGYLAEKELLLQFISNSKDHQEKIETATKSLKLVQEKIDQLEKTLTATDEKRKSSNVPTRATIEPLYYGDYLGLDKLLKCQVMESEKYGRPAHDEMLFIIVHQAFELWFKQILFEMEASITILNKEHVTGKEMARILHHLKRIVSIQRVLIEQLNVLETMTPLDFMDFRDFLFPASGFQSFQFRLVENKLGMDPAKRVEYNRQSYHTQLSEKHQELVKTSEVDVSLFSGVQKWLERTPFLKLGDYEFVAAYKTAGDKMFEQDREVIMRTTSESLNPEERKKELNRLEENKKNFHALFDQKLHEENIRGGIKRLSFKATQAALLIFIYQDEPLFQTPFQLLQTLVDIDEGFTSWRYRHALMVLRMIGTKVGTGGSSGYWYLKATIERGRIFNDIAQMPTYLLQRRDVPPLPSHLRTLLGFKAEGDDD